jgi:hypothetical protein
MEMNKRNFAIWFVVLFTLFGFALFIIGDCEAGRINHHDPNVSCWQVIPDYTLHPLYGYDCNSLPYFIDYATGKPWINEFVKYWLDCHPYSDPVSRIDINFDGHTDLKDFALLSTCRMVWVTKTGTKYHTFRDCPYLSKSRRPLLWVMVDSKYTPCSLCLSRAWLEGN